MRLKLLGFLLIVLPIALIGKPPKIVGLIAVHNEAALIRNCLRALAVYTDSIVLLDDASSDNTVEIVNSLKEECTVERIILKKEWKRDERQDKNMLLMVGREVGGTHFVMIDADEMFMAPCAEDNWLKKRILAMKPGQMMKFPMVNLWGSIDYYRDDELCGPKHWKWKAIAAVFCDDGQCDYNKNTVWGTSGTIHVEREPYSRDCKGEARNIFVEDFDRGLLHFKCVNLEDLKVKRIWYMCLEYIYLNRNTNNPSGSIKNADKINTFYAKEFASTLGESIKIRTSVTPAKWLDYKGIDPFCYSNLHAERREEIFSWINKYGYNYFKPLGIWYLDWMSDLEKKLSA